MTDPEGNLHPQQPRKAVTGRAVLIALPLMVANAFWLMANWGPMGYATGQSFATIVSLYYNVLFSLLLLLAVGALLRRLSPRWALSEGELLVIYILLTVASSVAGHDTLQILFPAVAYPIWFATPENRWGDFHRYIPDWLTVKDREALTPFFQGHSSLYQWENFSLWLRPVLIWCGFYIVLTLVMLCLVLLVRERWVRHEKLSYPIIQVPLALCAPGGALFRNRLLWTGFLLAAGMDLVNGLHVLYPFIPGLGGSLSDVGRFFTRRPYSAIGWTPVALYPFAVGLGFFIQLDLSFSIWFFYLFGKLVRIGGDVVGLTTDPRFPYTAEQASGAWVGLALVALWISRHHLARQVRGLLRRRGSAGSPTTATRLAWAGLLVGGGLLLAFSQAAGVSLGLALAYFSLSFAFALAITRARAEVGPPSHDLACEPLGTLVVVLGSYQIGSPALTVLTYFKSVDRAYRSHPMPCLLEGFALTERRGLPDCGLVAALIVAMVVGAVSCAWAYYSMGYHYGAAMFGEQWQCRTDFDRLASWRANPVEPDAGGITAMLTAGGLIFLLMGLRHSFLWFPLHPAGYALSLSPWNANWYWFSVLVGWLLKVSILKVGGLRGYRHALPFFIGMVLGEFMMGATWSLIGIALERPMYRFLF